jgi:hypothetical protein
MTDLIRYPSATAHDRADLQAVAEALVWADGRYSRIQICELLVEQLGRVWHTERRAEGIEDLRSFVRTDHPALRFRRGG